MQVSLELAVVVSTWYPISDVEQTKERCGLKNEMMSRENDGEAKQTDARFSLSATVEGEVECEQQGVSAVNALELPPL